MAILTIVDKRTAQQSFYDNVAGSPTPERACMDELLPDVMEGRIHQGRVTTLPVRTDITQRDELFWNVRLNYAL